MVLERGLQEDQPNSAKNHERAHDNPEDGAALFTFTFFKGVTAMAGVTSGSLVRAHLKKITEVRENLFRVDTDKAGVRADKTSDERFRRKLGVLIGLEQMQKPDVDFSRRRDLFDRDSAFFTLLPEELA
jgi:hypothetical protein